MIPSLINRTETGGLTVWQTGIQLEAQDASWIGENTKYSYTLWVKITEFVIDNVYATSHPQRQVGIALGGICCTFS